MKKFLAMLLASTLIVGSFAACNRNKPEPEQPPASTPEPTFVYQNGEYAVSYTVPALDRTLDYLTISVTDDVITVTDYGMKESGEPAASEASSSEAASADVAAGTSSASLTEHEAAATEYAELILEAFDAAGQDVDRMKAVEKAEDHTYRFMRMMRTALELAETGDTTPATLGKYADGSYYSVMPNANDDGWKDYVKLTVKDDVISAMEFNAMKGDDAATLITADAELNKGTNKPSEYYPQIPKNFTEAGDDLTKMLSPSGGGEATKTFGKLMRPLLINMVSGGATDVVASRYVDGTYKAEFKDFDKHGWKEFVILEIDNGVVTIKKFDATHKDDEKKLKSKDSELATQMKEKTGMNFIDAVAKLTESWSKAENDVTRVDNVAGATVSSNSFKLLVGQILATTAIEGDNAKPIVVERLDIK